MVVAVHDGDVEVGAAVEVEVAPGDAFDEAEVGEAAGGGDVGEGAVVVVVEELRGVFVAGAGLVADEDVEPAVVVEVGHGGGVGGVGGEQAGCFGDVVEGAVAVVAQEGEGVAALLAPPASAEDEDVGVAVVVVVGEDEVEAAESRR